MNITDSTPEYLTIVFTLDSKPEDSFWRVIDGWRVAALNIVGESTLRGSLFCGDSPEGTKVATSLAPELCAELTALCPDSIKGLTLWTHSARSRQVPFHRLVYCDYTAAPASEGVRYDPYVLFSFCISALNEIELAQLNQEVRRLLRVGARELAPRSAIVDVGNAHETGCGVVHASAGQGSAAFGVRTLRRLWITHNDRRDRLRGVFWGNVIGKALVNRLTLDSEHIPEAYTSLEDPRNSPLVEWFDDGSVLLLLSIDFRDLMQPYWSLGPNTLERAAWLTRHLARANLLPY